MTFKPFPEVELVMSEESSAMTIQTKRGDPIVIDTNCDTDALERMVECWNACRHLYSPAAHITETEAYVKRVEGLRKEAVARLEEIGGAA